MNGDWFNQEDEEELGSFSCQACVQVAGTGFKEVEAKNEQEIWYMNRMRLLDTEGTVRGTRVCADFEQNPVDK